MILCDVLLSSQIHGAWLRLAVVGRLLFQVFSLTCSSPIIPALRKACAFVCVAGGVVRTLGIRLFEKHSSRRGQVSQPDDVDCIVASSFASQDAFLV